MRMWWRRLGREGGLRARAELQLRLPAPFREAGLKAPRGMNPALPGASRLPAGAMFGRVLLVGFAIGCVATYLREAPVVHGSQPIPAFVVQQVKTMFNENSWRPPDTSTQTFARQADGSWSRTYTARAADGRPRQVLEFVDLRRMIAVETEPVTKSVTTHLLSADELGVYAAAAYKSCDDLELRAGTPQDEMILGYNVVLLYTKYRNGTERSLWVAPALGCYPLKSTFRTAQGDHADYVVTAVRVEEPPASMFEAPSAEYVERSPKEIEALYRTQIPRGRFFSERDLERLERKYQSTRKK
jgi:hypothetical protein